MDQNLCETDESLQICMSATALLVFHSESPCSVEGALENSSFRRLNLAKYHVYLNPFASMCTDCSPVAVMSPHEGELSSECFRGCDRYLPLAAWLSEFR